jgi:CRISPR/Cas system-associated exonuclease Cas4 (RecB family)
MSEQQLEETDGMTAATAPNFLNRAFLKSIEVERKAYPQHVNRASSAGDECTRRLLYRRTRWSEAILPPVDRLRRFEAGKEIEDAVKRRLEKGGVAITQSQRPLEWKSLSLTGHIDGVVRCPDGIEAVLEIKSCSPFAFATVSKMSTAVDLLNAEAAYMRGYPTQALLYALLLEIPRALIFFVDKSSWMTHTIEIDLLDPAALAVAEAALKRFELVNAAVAAKEDIAPTPGDYCGDCQFRHVCLTDQAWQQRLHIVDDIDMAATIARAQEIKHIAAEYDKLNEKIKGRFNAAGVFLVGDWQITAKESLTTRYDIPDAIKKTYARKVAQVRRTFANLNPNASTTDEE